MAGKGRRLRRGVFFLLSFFFDDFEMGWGRVLGEGVGRLIR